MVLRLTPECLDRWTADCAEFQTDLLSWSQSHSKAVGYYFDFDGDAIRIAHSSWTAQCEVWNTTLLMPNSKGLSHLKMMAILLHELSKVEWLTKLYEFDGNDRNGLEFKGSQQDLEEIRDDINGGGGTYFSFQFALAIIGWFESGRIDKKTPFVLRLTHDLEHDIMVYLLSGRGDAMATFLILKALYIRDDK